MAQDEPHKRDAIIFVPGMGRESVAQQIDTVARRFAGALDRQAGRAKPRIRVIGAPEEKYGATYRTPVRTIVVQEPGSDDFQPLADLYEFDYRDNLTKRFTARKPLIKALVMMGVIIAVFPRFLLSLIQKGKGVKDKIQILTMGGLMVVMATYMVLMIGAAVTTLSQMPEFSSVSKEEVINGQDETSTVEVSQLSAEETVHGMGKGEENGKTGARLNPFQALVIVFAALGLFQKKSLKEVVSTLATEYVCASNYLRMANQKPVILGQGAALLEHIAEKEEAYRRVHIVAYSFGTLVALDTLFSHAQPGARISTVHSLVTIGCPFDMVRMYWPDYFNQRNRQSGVPAQWVNLYDPLDVFGSNFRNDNNKGKAECGVGICEQDTEIILPTANIAYDIGMQTQQLTLFDLFTVKGIRIHSSYWTGGDAPEVSCFDNVARELYGEDPLLVAVKE